MLIIIFSIVNLICELLFSDYKRNIFSLGLACSPEREMRVQMRQGSHGALRQKKAHQSHQRTSSQRTRPARARTLRRWYRQREEGM